MKESKKELERAVLAVGNSLGMKRATEILLVNAGVHSTIKELIYAMFVENRQPYFEKDDAVFESMSLIRKYCKEMKENGEVNFDTHYDKS